MLHGLHLSLLLSLNAERKRVLQEGATDVLLLFLNAERKRVRQEGATLMEDGFERQKAAAALVNRPEGQMDSNVSA